MNPSRLLLGAVVALMLNLAAAKGAEDPALQGLDATKRRVVAAYLARQQSDGMTSSPDQAIALSDDRILLRWTSYFGNSQASTVSLLERGTKGWHLAGKAELRGTVTQMSVDGDVVRIDAVTTGPNDARCCPTVRVVQRFRLARGLPPLR
jgi:hypothetical protein